MTLNDLERLMHHHLILYILYRCIELKINRPILSLAKR